MIKNRKIEKKRLFTATARTTTTVAVKNADMKVVFLHLI